jgi:deoxycytidylate deaminase
MTVMTYSDEAASLAGNLLGGAIRDAMWAAKHSACAKDQRGAAVWHPEYGVIVNGHNGPPDPFTCDGSEACRAACGKLAVHAEMRAVLKYQRTVKLGPPVGMHVLHIRTVDGKPVTSGPPSCISCSRDMLEAGVAVVWLWHDTGWTSYPAEVFHRLSLQHEKHRLPVIRRT